jgi:V8-like Glu-specific endopeptidase
MKEGTFCPVALASLAAATTCLAYDTALPVSASVLEVRPYNSVGLAYCPISANASFFGSGSLVGPRCIVTAAHLPFNESNLTWRTVTRFILKNNDEFSAATTKGATMAGIMKLSSYSAAMSNEDNYRAFNSDFVAMYALSDIGTVTADYDIQYAGTPSLAAECWQALLLGYPSKSGVGIMGNMYQTGPNPWPMTEYFADEVDPANLENLALATDRYGAVHAAYLAFDSLEVYGGNSGGPLLVKDEDEDLYVQVGMVVGGTNVTNTSSGHYSAVFRTIDEAAYGLMESAMKAGGASEQLLRSTPTVRIASGVPVVTWADTASGETAWQVRRNDGDCWRIIATTGANATAYTDSSAPAGIGANYAVRAIRGDNRGPWSPVASSTPVRHSAALAGALAAPYLFITSTGDAPFVAGDGAAISGRILNLEQSEFSFPVDGPCIVKFKWQVSCEATGGDGLSVLVDDVEKDRIQGLAALRNKSLTISESGRHTVTFSYAKGTYLAAGEDCGRSPT